MSLYLTALGLINALGHGKRAVADRLFGKLQSGLIADDHLIPGRQVWVGAVRVALPEIPASLQRYDCCNNRLALAALAEIRPEVEMARRRYGNGRIGVILGTSSSGIAEGEAALAVRMESGAW